MPCVPFEYENLCDEFLTTAQIEAYVLQKSWLSRGPMGQCELRTSETTRQIEAYVLQMSRSVRRDQGNQDIYESTEWTEAYVLQKSRSARADLIDLLVITVSTERP